jgi:UDP-3-O-[3-hydroxymyristoyl] glucosamine N-acyltransferase
MSATSYTTGSIAAALKAELLGPADLPITGLQSIDQAGPGSLTFVRSEKFAHHWVMSKATAALVSRGIALSGHDPKTRAVIVVPDADLAMVEVLKLFLPPEHRPDPGVHPTAVVDPTARIGHGVRIGAYCVIGPRCVVGDGVVLHPRVTLGAEVAIGPMTVLHPGVVIYDRCTIGGQCILHGNVTIGADGFGYRPDPQGRGLVKIPHIGGVTVGHQVEIGAGTCIDRGKFGQTTIGDGTKIDNLCQIGHNVRIGRACVVCGVTGIGGSTTIGDGVIIAGHVGIKDGVTIGPRATISAKAGVLTDVPAGETYFGTPAGPHKEQMRAYAALRKLSDHLRAFKKLERAGLAPDEHAG